MKKSSLEDVANALGVSKTLVSMVLNGKGDQYGISKNTQARVWQMVEEMGFRPNATARKLRTGKSNVWGLIVADISNPFYAKIARSIEDAAGKMGYNLLICSSDEKSEREAELISVLVDQHQVDGLIISSTLSDPEIFIKLEKRGLPFLLLDRDFTGLQFSSVTVDNKKGAEMVVQHLADNGHKKIGLISLSPSHLSSLKDRITGYKDGLVHHGLEPRPQWIREVSFADMRAEINQVVRELSADGVTAIFALNNLVALYTLEAIRALGLSIPKDIALVSFDDIDVFNFTSPAITAISQPLEGLGASAVTLLYDMLQKKDEKTVSKIVLPVELKVRASCI